MLYCNKHLPKSPELTPNSVQQLLQINIKTEEHKTTTFYDLEENIPACPICTKELKKADKIAKTYYDKPINNQPNIIVIYRRTWRCKCKKFQPTPLDPKVLAIYPFSKCTLNAISYIKQKTEELFLNDTHSIIITKTLSRELGMKPNAINKQLKPILTQLRKNKLVTPKSIQSEYLALKDKRENSEIPLTSEERTRFKQLQVELSSKYGF